MLLMLAFACTPCRQQRQLLKELETIVRGGECPHIVRFYGALFSEGDCWVCMELMVRALSLSLSFSLSTRWTRCFSFSCLFSLFLSSFSFSFSFVLITREALSFPRTSLCTPLPQWSAETLMTPLAFVLHRTWVSIDFTSSSSGASTNASRRQLSLASPTVYVFGCIHAYPKLDVLIQVLFSSAIWRQCRRCATWRSSTTSSIAVLLLLLPLLHPSFSRHSLSRHLTEH